MSKSDSLGPSRSVSVCLRQATLQKLRAAASFNSRTVSGQIRFLILQFLTNFEKKHGEIPPPPQP